MSEQADKAAAMFGEGFNCAQSVLACCGEKLGIGRDMACHVAQAFGGGMCHTGQTCGAVTGALMVIGLAHAKTGPDDAPKARAAQLVQEFMRRFQALHGHVTCNDLLGMDLGKPENLAKAREQNLFRTACPRFVRSAADILDTLLA